MNRPDPADDFALDIEGLVRARLEREAEAIDPRPMFARIVGASTVPATAEELAETRYRSDTGFFRRTRGAWKWVGAAVAAAAVLVAGRVLLLQDRAALAKGETVVREARRAHLQPIDRSYLVEVRRESSLVAELSPIVPQVRQTRLWTRGDRFWVESVRPDQRWAWGRDEVNRFWIAFGPRVAVRLDADEVPSGLGLFCDLHALNVERWLGEVLDHFELTRETKPADASTIVVHARAQADAPAAPFPVVKSADFEIDAETRVVRRMVVRRVLRGEPFATVTYTLAETDVLDPAAYRLEGHLDDPAEVFTRDHRPERRRDLLVRWFGPRAAHWFPPPAPTK
jgi:hypothetical protein